MPRDEEGSDLARTEPGDLVRRFADLVRRNPGALERELSALPLREQAEVALRLPAAERLQLLVHAPQPMRLVRALPDSEFYLTVREVGPADALDLFRLASADQLRHLFDLEAWRGDRFDAERAGAWLALVAEAGSAALTRFLRNADEELLGLLYMRFLHLEPIETDEPPDRGGPGYTESGDERGLVTPDGLYRLRPTRPEHLPIVSRIVRTHFQLDPGRFGPLLWDVLHMLPAELEEDALRWRQSRLEEHGFPPWEEALSVYAPPPKHPAPAAPPGAPAGPDLVLAPRSPLRFGPAPLAHLLESVPDADRERVLFELVALANRLLVADRADPGDPGAHQAALSKAASGVLIALEQRDARGPLALPQVLPAVSILDLFRESHAPLGELQARARSWVRATGAADDDEALELLDEPLRARLLGLLARRPEWVELQADGAPRATREFRSAREIEEAATAVEMVEALGRLARRLGPGEPTRFSTLLLTALAWHATRGELRVDPLPESVAREFLRAAAAAERAMRELLEAVARVEAWGPRERSLLQAFANASLERLRTELGSVDPDLPLDRRAVACLLLAD